MIAFLSYGDIAVDIDIDYVKENSYLLEPDEEANAYAMPQHLMRPDSRPFMEAVRLACGRLNEEIGETVPRSEVEIYLDRSAEGFLIRTLEINKYKSDGPYELLKMSGHLEEHESGMPKEFHGFPVRILEGSEHDDDSEYDGSDDDDDDDDEQE